MSENINRHVERLNRFLPFSPAHHQIFEEFQQSEDSLNLETKALSYALDAICASTRMIVLTGDAGHGKTHLCRRILQVLHGHDENAARQIINERCNGAQVIAPPAQCEGAPALRVFKDFSEIPIELAADCLETAAEDAGAVTVVCANEGRLRAVLSSTGAGDACQEILNAFNKSFFDGLASRDGSIHLINLNFQSVAAAVEQKSLVDRAIRDWTSGTRWSACRECSSRLGCPIAHNRDLLGSQGRDGKGETRRRKIEALLATLERTGVVVTMRDMLMVVALVLTSGLRCNEVHKRLRRKQSGWQHQHVFYNVLFQTLPNVVDEKLKRIPVLAELRALDPGRLALRRIDEQIINDPELFSAGQLDLQFADVLHADGEIIDAAHGIDEILGNPRNRKERQQESQQIQNVVRSLRRRAFFDDEALSPELVMKRIGFEDGASFLDVIGSNVSPPTMARLKRKVLAGLHTIQGLQLGPSETELYLVDPAFGNATSFAAIIADTVPAEHIQIIPLAKKWSLNGQRDQWTLPNTVDWIDRHLVLRVTDDDATSHDLLLDLTIFDCIVRAAGGYVAEQFYAHDIRRISSFLGKLAESRKRTDERITLFLQGRRHSVSLDEGLIQVGGGS